MPPCHATISSLACLLSVAAAAAAVSIPTGSTWALLAWGWENGGKDNVTSKTTVVDLDLFDQVGQIPALKSAGHTVICYLSAGSWESWRPDANNSLWADVKIGKMGDWDELWLDIRKLSTLQVLMGARLKLASTSGCDGIEPDNTDCYDNKDCWSTMANPTVSSGKEVQPAQIAYNTWLATYAHSLGMVIGLKNTLDLVGDLHSVFDFAVNEQCIQYKECDTLAPFKASGKGILGVYYTWPKNVTTACEEYTTNGISGKYCHGSSSNGLCTSGAWANCF